MDKEKKSYFLNVVESKDGKIAEVMNFNFCGHHDLAAMVDGAVASGIFEKDKHAKEFVLGMRMLHHALKKNADAEMFAEFIPQFKAFKDKVRGSIGCSSCSCDKE